MMAAATAPESSSTEDPQLYLQELSLQDCTCQSPALLPVWRKWGQKANSGKRKLQPSARGGHSSVWIPFGSSPEFGSILIFGGSNRSAETFNDLWRFDLHTNEYSQPKVEGALPPVRSGHTAIYQPSQSRMIIYGGQQLTLSESGEMAMKFHRDVWTLNCQTWRWTKLVDSGDAPQRNGHSAILLTSNKTVIATTTSSTTASPSVSDSSSDSMIVFGGSDSEGPSAAVWSYDLTSSHWSQIATLGANPDPRELHGACLVECDSTRWMCISSGRGMNGLLNTCYALRLPDATPSSPSPSASSLKPWTWSLIGQSPSRCAHTMVPLEFASPTAPILPILNTNTTAAEPNDSTTSATTQTTTPTLPSTSSPTPSSPNSSITFLLFGGTDGIMFYNDVLSFTFTPASIPPDASTSLATAQSCPSCQGPPGWTILQVPDEKQSASAAASESPSTSSEEKEATATTSTPTASTSSSSTPPSTDATAATAAKKKSKKKKPNLNDVQPPTCFAHSLTPIPVPSPAFAHQTTTPTAPSSSSSALSSSSTTLVPGTYFSFGGMNDEADLDLTHWLSLIPFPTRS